MNLTINQLKKQEKRETKSGVCVAVDKLNSLRLRQVEVKAEGKGTLSKTN